MAEPERTLDEHQSVHAVVGRSGIEQGRFSIAVVRGMGMAKEDRVDIPVPALPLDRSIIVVHAELIAVRYHEPERAGIEKDDPFDIKAAGHVDIAADAYNRNTFRYFNMEKVINAIAAMHQAVKRIFTGYNAAKLRVVPVGIGDNQYFTHF